jgi:ADP-ribosyl-[dinitrogen reductase] hydrolase
MITDPIYNALIGLAVGDSAGYPFEFSENPLPEDVLFFAKRTNKVISDDTQMTLFGFEAVK